MTKHSAIKKGVIAAIAMMNATPLMVQAQEAASEGAEVEAITVTGSRIQRAEYTTNSPISVVDDSEIKFQGATSIESVLNKMPQFTADANENVSNGSDGTSQINLRNLGSNRVLTLVNGQRMLPTMGMDVNFIPSALVERVDVVTGGASAVYGSDAISGVVNFILKDDLNGIIFDIQGSGYQHNNDDSATRDLVTSYGYEVPDSSVWDGEKYDFNFAAGTDFVDGKGNITFYAGYRRTEPVLQSERDYSACAISANSTLDGYACGGSGNNPWGRFSVLSGTMSGGSYNNVKDGSKEWDTYGDEYLYNYNPLNYIQRVDRRYTAGMMTHYAVTDTDEVYGSFMFMDDQSFSQIAPSALWFGDDYAINCDNPLMSSQQAAALCGTSAGTSEIIDAYVGYRLDGENARPRRDNLRHTDYRFNLGMRGDINDGITYDVSYLRTTALYQETFMNDVNPERAARALLATDVNGVATCNSVIDGSDSACVPIDVFAYSGISDEAFDYILTSNSTESTQTLDVLSAFSQIDLDYYDISLPWAMTGPAMVVGYEHRKEVLDFEADAIAESYGTEDAYGVIEVDEVYTEIDIPLVEDASWAKYLGINAGLRYSEYTNSDDEGNESEYDATTYKFELSYSPNDDLRFRASFNHAIRAPNVSELFSSQGLGNYSGTDPCSGANPTATFEQCARTGVTEAQYGNIIECPAETCVQQYGGNPNLRPEEADTYTVGIVITPEAVENLSVSLDYYNIKVEDYIGSIDPNLIINQCIATGNSYYCDLFNRSRAGTLFGTDGYVTSTTLNTGYLQTSGVDINANYTYEMGEYGSLGMQLVGTYLNEMVTEPQPGLGTYDCKGLYGPSCGQPVPEWRHNARATWMMPWMDAQVSLLWRYMDSVKLSLNESNEFLTGTNYEINAEIGSYSYFDLAGSIPVGDHLVFRGGINNLLDRDPPIIVSNVLSSFGNGNTFPGMYDPLGRSIYIGLTASF